MPLGPNSATSNALACDKEYAPAHANLALALLLRGEYLRGFEEFEWRLKLKHFYHVYGFAASRWRGEPLEGRTILLHAEQGYGDTLQFLRYVGLVAARGARVVLAVQAALRRLLAEYPGVALCIAPGTPVPTLDFECPLMSLPQVFGTAFESIPAVDPLAPSRRAAAPGHGETRGHSLEVGLVWSGNPRHLTNDERSIPLSSLAPLAKLATRVSFISLQHGPSGRVACEPGQAQLPFRMRDACPGAADFAQTADVIAELDLVITVDTAVAHLAACLGKPVWVLLGPVPDWRWGIEGATTPWYPAVRLFRSEPQGGRRAYGAGCG